MQIVLGVVFALLLLAAGTHVTRTYRDLKASGVLPATGKAGSRPQRARKAVQRAPETVRVVIARGLVDNWVNRRQHKRENPREPLMRRLVVPRGKPETAPAVPAPRVPADPPPDNVRALIPKTADGDVPQKPAQVMPRPRPQPAPERTPQMPRRCPRCQHYPVTGDGCPKCHCWVGAGSAPPSQERTPPMASGIGGAASDLFSAVSKVTVAAAAGGIRAKAHAFMVLSEGCSQQAVALEKFAQDLADAEYPPMVYEPLIAAASHMRASAVSSSQAGSALNMILAMPARDLAASGIRVPNNAEFNKE